MALFSIFFSSVLFKLQDTLHVLVAGTVRTGEENDRPTRRRKKKGEDHGYRHHTASGCCCFSPSSPYFQNIVHARRRGAKLRE